VNDKKLTFMNSTPASPNVKKDQSFKVIQFSSFVDYSAGWYSVQSTTPLVLQHTSQINIPVLPANFMSSHQIKLIGEAAEKLSNKHGALQTDDDIDFPLISRSQQWRFRYGSNRYWTRGSNQGELTTGPIGSYFTVEQSNINNQIVISDGNGSYIRAVKMLPYIILEFGANKDQATSFVCNWIDKNQVILSTNGVQRSTQKQSSRVWLTEGKFVYLSKKGPSDALSDNDAVLSVIRSDP